MTHILIAVKYRFYFKAPTENTEGFSELFCGSKRKEILKSTCDERAIKKTKPIFFII